MSLESYIKKRHKMIVNDEDRVTFEGQYLPRVRHRERDIQPFDKSVLVTAPVVESQEVHDALLGYVGMPEKYHHTPDLRSGLQQATDEVYDFIFLSNWQHKTIDDEREHEVGFDKAIDFRMANPSAVIVGASASGFYGEADHLSQPVHPGLDTYLDLYHSAGPGLQEIVERYKTSME